MSTYLKHQGSRTFAQLKKLADEEIKVKYERLVRSIANFIPMGAEERVKRPRPELQSDTSKKQKTTEVKEVRVIEEPVKEPTAPKQEEIEQPIKKSRIHKSMARKRKLGQSTAKEDEEYEKEKEELSLFLIIAFDEHKEVEYKILDQRSPIIAWNSEYYGPKPLHDEVEVLEEINMNVVTRLNGSKSVDTTAAATTSTRAAVTTNFATDVNPDLVGPSQPKESEGSDNCFYEPPTLNPSEAKRCGLRCSPPPFFFSALRTMDYDHLYTEFNVEAVRQVCLGAEVRSRAEHELELKEKFRAKYTTRGRLLEEKDLEILRLKSQLAEKEAEAVEVIHLCDQVSSLSEEKSALTTEVSVLKVTVTQKDHDISLLNSHATCLASTLDDAKVACAEAGNKITSLASE
ncbi:hypothetical protein Tco_0373410 [Tanacetum coccineum]